MVMLIPLDSPEDQRRLLSMQLTGCWMSEAIEMHVDLIDSLSGRLGRCYPSAALGGASWFRDHRRHKHAIGGYRMA